jgi:GNAT superfamily N-acetyltransferase
MAEAQRRQRLGRYVMTWTLRWLWEQGWQGCWLTMGSENFPAQPLYLSLGFEIVDTSSSWQLTKAL